MINPNNVPRLKHLDSLASKVNVLGTVPQTVDGGLWHDSNVINFFASSK